jgi:hypothetical protein
MLRMWEFDARLVVSLGVFVLLEETVLCVAELRSAIPIPGAQCVMTAGTIMMPEWSAAN